MESHFWKRSCTFVFSRNGHLVEFVSSVQSTDFVFIVLSRILLCESTLLGPASVMILWIVARKSFSTNLEEEHTSSWATDSLVEGNIAVKPYEISPLTRNQLGFVFKPKAFFWTACMIFAVGISWFPISHCVIKGFYFRMPWRIGCYTCVLIRSYACFLLKEGPRNTKRLFWSEGRCRTRCGTR